MMIENAERFGLAQLHQLRGRVGRGDAQSYCIFIYGQDNKKVKERLDIMLKTNDGFKIASEDLKLRGPGDMFGICLLYTSIASIDFIKYKKNIFFSAKSGYNS